MVAAKELSRAKAFDCEILRFEHTSKTLGNLTSKFSIILPERQTSCAGLLIWLSGLSCTDENFIIKAGAAKYAKMYNMAIACPDTSPRGANAPAEDESWDFGTGASFYVDATEKGYENYQMETYIVREFVDLISSHFADRIDTTNRIAISGHSMGGMGALCLAMRHRDIFSSVSAFAPIAHPTQVPWGQKCFTGYLGDRQEVWDEHDPTMLVKTRGPMFDSILIDQGTSDSFLHTQLLPDRLLEVCKSVGQKLDLNMAEGYDHSYFFVQTFLEKHVRFHAEALGVWQPLA